MFGGYITNVDFAAGLGSQFYGLGQTKSRMVERGTAGLASIHFRFGETNRYSKDHLAPISVDSIPVSIPAAVKNAPHLQFPHSALNITAKEIRLLELLPARWSKVTDFVACRMVKRDLSDKGGVRYETLSYCWGRQARNVPVFIVPTPLPEDGKVDEVILVTPQLYAALRRLRLEEASRYLWIDQLCIDQMNGEEKGEQVLLMGEIYSTSWRTVIWLGEEDRHRAHIESLLQLVSSIEEHSDEQFSKAIAQHLDSKAKATAELQALEHLLNRDYFTRAWIFQEAVLGNDLLIYYGGLQITFQRLCRLVDAVKSYQYGKGGYSRSIMKTTLGCDTLALIQHARQSGSCGDPLCILFKEPNLLQVLFEALLRFSATDDRDLVYAFLSHRFQDFSRDNRVNPDYSKSVEGVWTDTALQVIAHTGSLDVFAAARAGEPAKYPDIPSWVPDWSYCFPYARPIYAPDLRNNFDACRGRKHTPSSEQTGEQFKLYVRGKCIRTISWLGALNFEASYYRDGIASFLQLDRHVSGVRGHLTMQRYLSNATIAQRWPDLRASVLRTLLADGAYGHTQPLNASTREIERILASEAEILQKKSQMDQGAHVDNVNRWRQDHDVLETLWGWSLIAQKKVLFSTAHADGSTPSADVIDLGLAASAVRPGDKIAILHGSRVPVVLRQVEAGWLVVAQCYLQGWMYESDARVFWSEEDADVFVLV